MRNFKDEIKKAANKMLDELEKEREGLRAEDDSRADEIGELIVKDTLKGVIRSEETFKAIKEYEEFIEKCQNRFREIDNLRDRLEEIASK